MNAHNASNSVVALKRQKTHSVRALSVAVMLTTVAILCIFSTCIASS